MGDRALETEGFRRVSEHFENVILEADGLFDCRLLDEALEKYEEVLRRQPSERRALNRVARIHAMRGRIRELVRTCFRWQECLEEDEATWPIAAAVAEAILRFDPHSLEARLAMLRHLQKTAAEADFVAVARRDARYFVEVGSGELSIQVLRKALESFPNNVELSLDLADMHVAQGHLQEAVVQFRHLASQFEGAGDRLRAADAYRRLKLLLPESPDVSMRLGQIYMEHDRCDDAITEFRNVLRLNLTHREALLGLGEASIRKGAQRDAILAFRKVLAVDPRDAEAHERLAEVYLSQGMAPDAIKELLAAGMTCMELQDYRQAKDLYSRVLELEPENPTAVRELSNATGILAEQAEARKQAEARQQAEADKQAEARRFTAAPPPAPAPALATAPVSEDDLYAAATPSEDDFYAVPLATESFAVLGAPGTEMAALGAPLAPEPEPEPFREVVRPPVTRVLVEHDVPEGTLHDPVPFLFLSRPELLQAIREQVEDAPDYTEVPWEPLRDLDADKVQERVATILAASEKAEVTTARFSGPIQSAFGASGGFAQAFTSGGAKTRRRRGSWEWIPSGRGPRGDAPGPAEPDAQAALAERIARRKRGEQVDDDE